MLGVLGYELVKDTKDVVNVIVRQNGAHSNERNYEEDVSVVMMTRRHSHRLQLIEDVLFQSYTTASLYLISQLLIDAHLLKIYSSDLSEV